MWDELVKHTSVDAIMRDKGLARIGDGLVNLCYSLAKSVVLGSATGEKVRDAVLALALRSTPIYRHIGRRTDAGDAADAYEAILAYIWMTGGVSIDDIVKSIVETLDIDKKTNRKQEAKIAAKAFQVLLERYSENLPGVESYDLETSID
jgi:hypothetical protein